jgi:hypothetical protein
VIFDGSYSLAGQINGRGADEAFLSFKSPLTPQPRGSSPLGSDLPTDFAREERPRLAATTLMRSVLASHRRVGFVMIKPTHYDDDGYPILWYRSAIPSNTLACLNGLAEYAHRRNVSNRRAQPERIIREIRNAPSPS